MDQSHHDDIKKIDLNLIHLPGYRGHLLERSSTPSPYKSEQPGPQVPGWVDGIATVEAKTETDGSDDKSHTCRDLTFGNLHILGVCDGTHRHQENSCG